MPGIDTFDDHELDQYLPNGLHNGHMVAHSQSEQYSSCYQGNPVTSSASSWSGVFRPSTGSCMQSYNSQNANSANAINNSSNANTNIPTPYDLSSANSPPQTGASPNAMQHGQQTSSPTGSMHSPSYPGNQANAACKLREEGEGGVKIEPVTHTRGPAPRYHCDTKFDYNNVPVTRYEGSAHQNMSYVSNTHAQYMHSLNYSHMGMPRQMFNPIAAAVPSEQQWERFT